MCERGNRQQCVQTWESVCVCVQWDVIVLQCLWNPTMRAMCFYELIKLTFEAKQREMMERGKEEAGEAREDRRNNTKEVRKGQTQREKENKRDCCVFASK